MTVVLTYEDGVLVKAVTRGNGEIGEVITNNAKVFANLPNQIAYKGPLTIRGEAVITYTDFERINATIPDIDSKYKNPRNLCSGSVRQLNNQITAERNVHFFAFNMLDTGDAEIDATMNSKFDFLTSLGFEVVEHVDVTAATMQEMVTHFAEKIETNDFPSDGLVLSFDDVEYGKSLGRTAKFPRDSIAFKWADEEAVFPSLTPEDEKRLLEMLPEQVRPDLLKETETSIQFFRHMEGIRPDVNIPLVANLIKVYVLAAEGKEMLHQAVYEVTMERMRDLILYEIFGRTE